MKAANKKGLITTLVVVGLGAAAYFLFIRNKGNKKGGNRGGGENSELDEKMLPIANAIFDAMDGYGTNEDTIETQLKKLTSKNDWDALVRAFGVRTISSGSFNVFQKDFQGDLVSCLNNELDAAEIERVNQILSKIGVSI